MSISIQEIQAPITGEMDVFELKFRSFMKTNVMLLDQIMNYIVKRKGKQPGRCLYSCLPKPAAK